jgi:16S rRNA (guanine527-N7)-methyltransferase
MEEASITVLAEGLRTYGLEPSVEQYQAVVKHLEMVAEWNERINLTRITDEREMVVKHVLDSATAFSMVNLAPGAKVADVGTGAGFPGVTWKCLAPGIDLTLMDSTGKRCKFLEEVGNEVVLPLTGSLDGYSVAWGRAEDLGHKVEYRGQFDVVSARAVAELRVLVELCLPLCKKGGTFLAFKGPNVQEELEAASLAIFTLGGVVEEVKEFMLPDDAGSRTLIRIRKERVTPRAFPRQAGTPARKPL